uniref:non-specific serine/threonine protein kinase n=1 Tax=Helianthus annuus TaxID=4232 RepID=A0A251T7U7_HELAN
MKLGKNFITGRETNQTSWRSADDPSPGEYTLSISAVKGEYRQVYIRRSSVITTRIGPYNGVTFSGRENYAPDASPASISYVIENQNEIYITFITSSNTTTLRSALTPDGKLEILQLKFHKIVTLSYFLGTPKKTLNKDYKGNDSQIGSAEVLSFSFAKISRATDDFSIDNKLGEGGFGPVYKGVLEEGQEIAVKRLSNSSQQGLVVFENEVICIAKLQHRNLVKLLGYCIQGVHKMLIYEYMPNKSLDSFLFDESKKSLLDWPQRFHIIHGIARGLLYLHQDSRLKVVHRDLKAGNILLDHQMRPKISDFGLARIFKEDEGEANTKRVVGTLGYISPEYAMKVNGKKNRDFVHEDRDDSLLGHFDRIWWVVNVEVILGSG